MGNSINFQRIQLVIHGLKMIAKRGSTPKTKEKKSLNTLSLFWACGT